MVAMINIRTLLSILLCLFLPVTAIDQFEATPKATPELYTIDFGDFTMGLYDGDYYDVAPAKVNNQVYAMIYPAYNETDTFHNNINVVWCKDDAAATIKLFGPEAFARMQLKASQPQHAAMGIKETDAQVLKAVFEDGKGCFITSATLDYTGAGVDLITPIYRHQVYFCNGEAGTYIITSSSNTLEDMEAMSSYLDSVVFK